VWHDDATLFWIFLKEDQLGQNPLQITGVKGHHLARVLRIRPGEEGVAVAGGRQYLLRVESVKGDAITASIGQAQPAGGELPVRVSLVQAALPNPDFDQVLEAGTALGISRFLPVLAARSVARPAAERVKRWRSIVESAAEQSHRGALPVVEVPASLGETLARVADSRLLALDPGASQGLRQAAGTAASYALAVGPEGGWTQDELAVLRRAAGIPVSLGPRILRARLAPIIAAAILIDHVMGVRAV
jgi:16S rRNA (uracil1498-N3)-methyltransferase